MNTCKIDECEKPAAQRGWCGMHYMRWIRNGDPLIRTKRKKKPHVHEHFMYSAWAGMVNRCSNPNNSSYERYGALGVCVCDRWRYGDGRKSGFYCFLEDMGERPEGMTLDRIDPCGNYEPANCRWATAKMQRNNLSEVGQKRALIKQSKRRKEYWVEWRRKNTIRVELTDQRQRRLLELLNGPVSQPSDKRFRKSLESLVSLGLATFDGHIYRINENGIKWIEGGFPERRARKVD